MLDALKEWRSNIFNVIDKLIKFYSQNNNLLPLKPKSTFRHLKQDIKKILYKNALVLPDKSQTT